MTIVLFRELLTVSLIVSGGSCSRSGGQWAGGGRTVVRRHQQPWADVSRVVVSARSGSSSPGSGQSQASSWIQRAATHLSGRSSSLGASCRVVEGRC
ncbi:hypothetical protein QBC39DRAFT_337654 [Podospora conica]|nr:hypothetical protein QBC39DRAFT_337654 [Schizothecium conicum]